MSKLPITTDEIEKRLSALEEHSHVPFDFTELIERIEALEAATPANSRAAHVEEALRNFTDGRDISYVDALAEARRVLGDKS